MGWFSDHNPFLPGGGAEADRSAPGGMGDFLRMLWGDFDGLRAAAGDRQRWKRGDGDRTITLPSDGSDAITDVKLKGVHAADVRLLRTEKGVALVVAPSSPRAGDGGTVSLAGFDPGHGFGTLILKDARWSAADLAAKAIAAQQTKGNDIVLGFSGDDQIAGGAGNDRLIGGAGNDTYRWKRGDGADIIDETGASGGAADKLVLTGVKAADVRFIIEGQNIRIVIGASAEGKSDGGSVTLLSINPSGQSGIDTVQLADRTLTAAQIRDLALAAAATAGDDIITGFSGNDTLIGRGGNDTLIGGGGIDVFKGGAGDDRYVVNGVKDTIVENAGEGTDTVVASVNFALGTNVENLLLTGSAVSATGNALDNRLTGNAADNVLGGGAGNDTLDGGTGADRMIGGAGDDSYYVDSRLDRVMEGAGGGTDTVYSTISYELAVTLENLVLTGMAKLDATGNSLANRLTGNAAANTLDGRGGNDTMSGGGGDDTYVVDAAGDVVVEKPSEGLDTVRASVSYSLAANVEKLTLTGTAAINGTGNALANTLIGNAAANLLDGGAGDDTLTGGLGGDSFVFTGAFGRDTITDFAAGAGADIIRLSLGSDFDSFAEVLAAAREVNGSTVLDFGALGTITLDGVHMSQLSADDFLFT